MIAAANTRAPARPADGEGGLEVEMVSGQSAVTATWATSPLKVLVPRPRGQSVWAYLSSFGGGLVAGDETSLSLQLGANTRCFVSTQASTKVYRNPDQHPCGHQLKATLKAGSLLALVPDPVQAFAGSSYVQRQEFQLESSAGLVLVDWFTSGRAARGERWAFDRFQSRNEVFIDGEPRLVDSLLLTPEQGGLAGSHRLGRFNCFALVVLVGDALGTARAQVLAEIAAQPVARCASLICSASPIPGGAVLRLAGECVEEVGREIHRHLGFLHALLGDDPLARKW
jgi:urease accessory protein